MRTRSKALGFVIDHPFIVGGSIIALLVLGYIILK